MRTTIYFFGAGVGWLGAGLIGLAEPSDLVWILLTIIGAAVASAAMVRMRVLRAAERRAGGSSDSSQEGE